MAGSYVCAKCEKQMFSYSEFREHWNGVYCLKCDGVAGTDVDSTSRPKSASSRNAENASTAPTRPAASDETTTEVIADRRSSERSSAPIKRSRVNVVSVRRRVVTEVEVS